jgi:hypothetical protein
MFTMNNGGNTATNNKAITPLSKTKGAVKNLTAKFI